MGCLPMGKFIKDQIWFWSMEVISFSLAHTHLGSTTTLKKNGWFFKKIKLASLALKFKWFLSLVEGAFICGMRHKINELDSPLGDKGACERRPKSKKEGPNGRLRYWNNWWWRRNKSMTITLWLKSISSRCEHVHTTHLRCNQFTCFKMVHQVNV